MSKRVEIVGAPGLAGSSRKLDAGKKGWLLAANNILATESGVYTPRFGLENLGATQTGSTRLDFNAVTNQIVRSGTGSDKLETWNGSSWDSLDTTRDYSNLVNSRGFAFLLSNEGLRRINLAGTSTEIGFVPEALDIVAAAGATLSGGPLPSNSTISYFVLFGIKNTVDEFALGAPSGRFTLANTSADTVAVDLTIPLPAEITTSHFYQVYRTVDSGDSAQDPTPVFHLCYEAYPTSAQITAKLVTLTDTVPKGNGGPAAYTNQDQQGDTQGNFPCEFVCGAQSQGGLAVYAECLFAHNYQPRSNIDISLMSVVAGSGLTATTFTGTTTNGSPTITAVASTANVAVGMRVEGTGIPANSNIISFVANTSITLNNNATASNVGTTLILGDRIVIGGTEYVAWTSTDIATGKFKVFTAGTVAQNPRDTAQELVKVINQYTSNTTFYARYTSSINELPGRMRLYARTDRASTYTFQVFGHPAAIYPFAETAQTIRSEGNKSTLGWSKPGEPMAWCLNNQTEMPGDAIIVDKATVRNSLMIGTTGGFYRLSGTYDGGFSLDLIDASITPLYTSTNPGLGMVVCDNVGYMLTPRGLVAITESAVRPVPNMPEQLKNISLDSTVRRLSVRWDALVGPTRSRCWCPVIVC